MTERRDVIAEVLALAVEGHHWLGRGCWCGDPVPAEGYAAHLDKVRADAILAALPDPEGGGPGWFWTRTEWAEWSNELATLIPEDDVSRYANPEGAQESIISDCFAAYVRERAALPDPEQAVRDAQAAAWERGWRDSQASPFTAPGGRPEDANPYRDLVRAQHTPTPSDVG